MKIKTTLLLIAFTAWFTGHSQSVINKRIEVDKFGRNLKSENGEKINYSFEETAKAIEIPIADGVQKSENIVSESTWEPTWKYGLMGESIGRNSMHSLDIDGDGTNEIICSAKIDYFNSFWYILKYSSANSTYSQIWVSEMYNSAITALEVYKGTDDTGKIFVGTNQGEIVVYDLISLQKHKTLVTDISEINQILIQDVDNDIDKELVFCNDNSTLFYDLENLTFEFKIEYGGNDFDIGDVDGDGNNEIAFTSGNVIKIENNSAVFYWQFHSINSDNFYEIELCDIDNDLKEEIICSAAWNYISIYDADINALKFQINTSHDIHALFIDDYDNNGVVDIVYGDGQWGEIHFINSQTQTEYKSISNPEHGVTAINIADVDNDGNKEVIWGAGWTSSGEDNLFVADIETEIIEYRSVHIDGPFYAIEVGDVDNDQQNEIVTFSYESGSGYDASILTIFDSETHEIEWQSDGNFFGSIWTGVYSCEIHDIDGDGVNEIILAAGYLYDGRIWVIDAINKTIKSEHTYGYYGSTIETDEFYGLAVGDTDNDNLIDFVVATNGDLYIMSAQNFSKKWSYESLWSSWQKPGKISISNVDSDQAYEIIVCAGKLYLFDGITKAQLSSVNSNYTNFSNYDYNGDGILDIIASTNTGSIEVISGKDLSLIKNYNFVNQEIRGVQVFTHNGSLLFVISYGNYVGVFNESGNRIESITLGDKSGSYDGLKVQDINNDGIIEIIVGTNNLVAEFSTKVATCISLNVNIEGRNVSCLSDKDGFANTIVSGGTEPYEYIWNDSIIANERLNIEAGKYYITVTDESGCSSSDSIEIKKSNLELGLETKNVECNTLNTGMIGIIIEEGTAPYSYNWTTGQVSSTLVDIEAGEYSVIVTDGMSCKDTVSAIIGFDKVDLNVSSQNISCHGGTNGFIYVNPIGGYPFTYVWNDSVDTNYKWDLTEGDYAITVTDSRGCIKDTSIYISQPDSIQIILETNFDDTTTVFGEGTATIVNITGGTSPFNIRWNDRFNQTSPNAVNLLAGKYELVIEDRYGCIQRDTFRVESYTCNLFNVEIEHSNVGCENANGGKAKAILNGGHEPYYYLWSNAQTTPYIDSLPIGNYSLKVTDSKNCKDSVVFNIEKDSLKIDISLSDESCYGSRDGYIIIEAYGLAPYTYVWETGKTDNYLFNLSNGNYNLIVSDARGCFIDTTLIINSPNPIEFLVTTSPDDLGTPSGEGTAEVSNITGGIPPYFISWSDSTEQKTLTAINLHAQNYLVIVSDSSHCKQSKEVTVGTLTAIKKLEPKQSINFYPNPTSQKLFVSIEDTEKLVLFEIFDLQGQLILRKMLKSGITSTIDLQDYKRGLYIIKYNSDKGTMSSKLVIE